MRDLRLMPEQRFLLRGKMYVQLCAVLINGEERTNLGKSEAHIAQRRDAADDGELGLAVVAVVGEGVGVVGLAVPPVLSSGGA